MKEGTSTSLIRPNFSCLSRSPYQLHPLSHPLSLHPKPLSRPLFPFPQDSCGQHAIVRQYHTSHRECAGPKQLYVGTEHCTGSVQ
eukprot:156433-Rhodomonas_salina.2